MSAPEHMPPTKSHPVVDAFHEEIDRWFERYWNFYLLTNDAKDQYRLSHVTLISDIYNLMMIALGDRIQEIRVAAYELADMINDRRAQVGDNACIRGVEAARDANSISVGALINACAVYANTTLSDNLVTTFYPTFAVVQTQTSVIPLSVIDILSRGNVLEDEQEILQYLADRFQAFEMQWMAAVSQVLRWETSRFNTENRFLADQVTICMDDATWQYLLTNSRLEGEIMQC